MSTHQTPKSKKWCSLHRSTTHSDRECRAQQANTASTGAAGTSRNNVAKNPVESRSIVDLGPASYVFMALRPSEAEKTKLPFTIDSGASDHFVDPDLLPPQYEIPECTEYDPPIDVVGAGSIILKGNGYATRLHSR